MGLVEAGLEKGVSQRTLHKRLWEGVSQKGSRKRGLEVLASRSFSDPPLWSVSHSFCSFATLVALSQLWQLLTASQLWSDFFDFPLPAQ